MTEKKQEEVKHQPPGTTEAAKPDVAYEIDYAHPHKNLDKPRKPVRPAGTY